MYRTPTQDETFHALGATHYYDSFYPEIVSFGRIIRGGALFQRSYFKGGVEIGYFIPDLRTFPNKGIHHFDVPRVWNPMPILAILEVSNFSL